MILTIEKLVYNGYGMGRTSEGLVVFVPYTAPGDRVRVRIVEQRRDFAFGEVVELLEPSSCRVEPGCPHFGVCGACQWLHVDYRVQLEHKGMILERELARVDRDLPSLVKPMVFKEPDRYRRRVKLVVERKLIGFRGFRSHRICGVGACRLITESMERALLVLYRFQSLLKYGQEIWMGEDLKEGMLLVSVKASRKIREIHQIYHELEDRTGLEVGLRINYRGKRSTLGRQFIFEDLCGAKVFYTYDTFFQANRYLTPDLVEHVVNAVPHGSRVLELYAGCGTFTIPLSRKAGRITAVEINPVSVGLLEEHTGDNVEVVRRDVEAFVEGALCDHDVVLVDPPRTGLTVGVSRWINEGRASLVVYVSCNPTTLARDIKRLDNYRVVEITPFDMFPHTFHLETVALLERKPARS